MARFPIVACLSAAILLWSGEISAQQFTYNVGLIPDSLKTNADAVLRLGQWTTEVKDLDNVDYQVHQVVTILDEDGKDEGNIQIPYDKFDQIKSIHAEVYDGNGLLIAKYKESDCQDLSAISDFALYQDERVKQLLIDPGNYPYTVDLTYEYKSKQSLAFDNWIPQDEHYLAVQQADYRFIAPSSFPVRTREFNIPGAPERSQTGSQTSLSWELTGLKATREEPLSPSFREYQKEVMISPQNFSYDGIKGSFSDWNELAKWVNDHLLQGRDQISADMDQRAHDLVKNASSPEDKARIIYSYVQSRTRYVAVSIGIGGMQPATALDVDQLGYGDCKGLVNYTMTLLHAVGVPALYTEVEAGSDKTSYLPDFPTADQGDHIILCLPLPGDTVWLDCTDKDLPFGYIGDFTDDRLALAHTPDGGVIVHTLHYSASENTQTRTARFSIDSLGNLSGTMTTAFRGLQYDDRTVMDWLNPEEKRERLKTIYPFNQLAIKGYSLTYDKQQDPTAWEKINLTSEGYGSPNQSLMYFPLNTVDRINTEDIPEPVRHRKNPVWIKRGFTDLDSLQFNIPAGYQVAYHPSDTLIWSPYGVYHLQTILKSGALLYIRQYSRTEGEFPASTYQDLLDFLQSVAYLDQRQVVLRQDPTGIAGSN